MVFLVRKVHEFKVEMDCRCPFESCGKPFTKKVTVQYVTNQKGEVIEQKII